MSVLCSWFPKEGTVNLDAWQKLGQEIKNQLKLQGPSTCPEGTMSIWEEIQEALDPQHSFELVSIASQECTYDVVAKGQEDPYKLSEDPILLSSQELRESVTGSCPVSQQIKRQEASSVRMLLPPPQTDGDEDEPNVFFNLTPPGPLRSMSQGSLYDRGPKEKNLVQAIPTGIQTLVVNHMQTQPMIHLNFKREKEVS